MPPEKKELDPYLLLVIETTSQKTAQAVIKEHQLECSINNLKREFYGDGTDLLPGVKTDVGRLKTDVKGLKDCKSGLVVFLRDKLVAPIVTAIIVAVVMSWSFTRPVAKACTTDTGTQTKVTDDHGGPTR